MLVTGSQISTAISSAIVCTFTSVLFFSGYVLQQRTVRDMQAILHPKITPTPLPGFEVQPIISDRKQQILSYTNQEPVNWKRVAYVRTLRDYSEVCEAVMLFSELTRQRSAAQKIIMYPVEWDTAASGKDHHSRASETALRLLNKAKREFKATLIALVGTQGPSQSVNEEQPVDDRMAMLLALASFDKVMYLQPKGLALDVEILDSLFAVPLNSSITALDGRSAWPHQSLLIQPSQGRIRQAEALREIPTGPVLDNPVLAELLLQTASLRDPSEAPEGDFRASELFEYTAYARFSDADIPGPEFDLLPGTFSRVQPRSTEHRSAWMSLYERYRLEMMSVCGLDLQPIVPVER